MVAYLESLTSYGWDLPWSQKPLFGEKNLSWGYGDWRREKNKAVERNGRRETTLELKVGHGRQGQR